MLYKKTYSYRLDLEYNNLSLSSKDQRRTIVSGHDEENDFKEDDIEEINVISIIQEYLQLIENKSFDQAESFLIHFSKQLNQTVFAAIEKTDEDILSYFANIFFQQLSNQTNEVNILQYLHTFYQLQIQFRILSSLTLEQENYKILLNFFDFENLHIKNELILIFTEYLHVNYKVFHIFKEKLFMLFQLNDPDIFQSLSNFISKYLIELTGESLLDQDLISIEPLLFSLLSFDENTNPITLKTLASVLKNLINNSLQTFLRVFDQKMLIFIEQLLLKSSFNQDFHSQMAVKNVLESILVLTSNRIPTCFAPQTDLIFRNFNLSIFLETLKNSQISITILSIQCIYNFILGGSIDRILSSDEIINLLMKELETGQFEVKQEIVLFFTSLIEISPLDYKVAYLVDIKFLTLITDLLPTFQYLYILNILKSIIYSISQCSGIPDFENIKNTFIEINFLHIFDLIDLQAENEINSEIQGINTLLTELLEN